MEATWLGLRNTLIEFRYEPGAFYARQLSDAVPYSYWPGAPRGTSCGYLKDDFWGLQPGATNGILAILTTGVERGPNKLVLLDTLFADVFSYYTSYGITADGVNSARLEGQVVVNEEHTYTASLVFSNALPIAGEIKRNVPDVIPRKLKCIYDPPTVPLPFPKEIIGTLWSPKPGFPEDADKKDWENKVILHLLVKEIEVADRSDRLSQALFSPDSEILGAKYEHYIITNAQRFRVAGKQLIRQDDAHNKLPPPPYQSNPRSRRGVLIFLVLTLFILPIVLYFYYKRTTTNRTKDKQ